MPDALGASIGGLFALAQSAINYGIQSSLTREQNQFNFDMWKTQAEYNSPVQQMKRYSEAGLNPYLVASQGNPGNMATAPVKSVPQAEVKGLDKLAQAFNIEGLRAQIADRKIKEAEAKAAENQVKIQDAEIAGKEALYRNFVYDIATGRYVPVNNNLKQWQGFDNPLAASYAFDELSKNFRGAYLLPARAQLIGAQRSYLVPQITMANYEAAKYPVTYWVGTVGKGIKALSDLTGIVNPSRYLMPIGNNTRGFVTPTGRVLNY